MKRETYERTLTIASPIALLVVWEIVSRLNVIDARYFPPPSAVLVALWDMAMSELWPDLYASLYRIFWGFWIGAIPAVVLGMIMGLSRTIRAILNPVVAATYPIPKSAIVPLLILVFGLGDASKIAMVTIGVFFPVLINTAAGVMEISPLYFDVGKNYGATRLRVLRTIALPGALPMIMAGVRLGVGLALILVVVAELVGSRNGLGYLILTSWNLFAVDRMYAGLIVISLIGYLSTLLVDEVERWLVPWKART